MVSFAVIFGLLMLLFGGVGASWGYSRRQYHDVVTGTPEKQVAAVDEPGLVQFEGEVTPVDGEDPTVSAPFSDEQGAIVGWHVEDWDESGDTQSWTPVAEGYAAAPFELDDGTGTIRVEAGQGMNSEGVEPPGRFANSVVVDGVDVDLGRFLHRHRVEPGGERPDAVAEFEERTAGLPRQRGAVTNAVDLGKPHGERRYSEATIQHGEDVYVLGRVASASGEDGSAGLRPADAVVRPVGDDPFILSARSKDELVDRTRWGTPAMLVGFGLVLWGLFSLSSAVVPL